MKHALFHRAFIAPLVLLLSCRQESSTPSQAAITALSLKRGQIITCGATDRKLGAVEFNTSCGVATQESFNLALQLLHSFEYDEAEKAFATVINKNPACAMAYWGVAMANFHPLWTPPSELELKKGVKAISIAQSIAKKSPREAAYIAAIAAYYHDWERVDHRSRCIAFEKAMELVHSKYPTDSEATIFYALALTAAADPADKQFINQRKAGRLLEALYPNEPNHPGIIHYIIHTYDYPELAVLALPAARRYAAVAPSSAHALHMPSHIFTRLGLWEECINSNLTSVASAQCYAKEAGIKGHWDEELHGMDYLVYAYLQRGQNGLAKQQLDYLKSIKEVSPLNFKVAYAFAAIPARYSLENKRWPEAASFPIDSTVVPWKDFPWQKAIIHFARVLGSVHTGQMAAATAELAQLKGIHSLLVKQKDAYKAKQVEIQLRAAEAWIHLLAGRNIEALALMNQAADLEDQTEKHPVTPSEVIPARELLGDMLLQLNQPKQALAAYSASLRKHPNRFNGLYNAGLAAERAGLPDSAALYYQQLIMVANAANSDRTELKTIRQFLTAHKFNVAVASHEI
ncbi:hypothetical protein AUC43_18790 [Hymenobacter sedentarius]|uniref:Uncharacterized protein n=1 Tax=Hymenobacter sedentarius TaxID=1411621 RepID=A0A0U4C923_9BACT|nr:tetratricopeptide repeat protein [Hymenobacter sedentarius]ALW87458.1 hypothetical protein AUC43_18790 [Hymenobacter sedentarius]